MSQSNQHYRIASLIQEIIDACKTDPTKLEVATVNFEYLIKAMKEYEKASHYYKAMLDEADNSPSNEQINIGQTIYTTKFQVQDELQKIFGRQLKHIDLQKIGSILSTKTGLKYTRNLKRNKFLTLRWFESNWEKLYPYLLSIDLSEAP